MTNQTINQLAAQWLAAKDAEKKSNINRLKIEQEIIEALHFDKLEGSKTEQLDNFKVTFTAKLNRKLDSTTWELIKDSIPEHMRPVKQIVTYKVDDKGCRYLEKNEPLLFAKIATAITTKPAKTAVKVEAL